jgi:hypothetical protein
MDWKYTHKQVRKHAQESKDKHDLAPSQDENQLVGDANEDENFV